MPVSTCSALVIGSRSRGAAGHARERTARRRARPAYEGFGVARGLAPRTRLPVSSAVAAPGARRRAGGRLRRGRGWSRSAAARRRRAGVELAGLRDVGGGLAELADALAERRARRRELAGAEHDERDDQDQDQLAGADVGNGMDGPQGRPVDRRSGGRYGSTGSFSDQERAASPTSPRSPDEARRRLPPSRRRSRPRPTRCPGRR